IRHDQIQNGVSIEIAKDNRHRFVSRSEVSLRAKCNRLSGRLKLNQPAKDKHKYAQPKNTRNADESATVWSLHIFLHYVDELVLLPVEVLRCRADRQYAR